tara:strand:- start:1450 stop:2097 length:648 start_codon:yes stop_codon:yes gene_type:complete
MNYNPIKITFPAKLESDWKIFVIKEISQIKGGKVEINCSNCLLNCRDLLYLQSMCNKLGIIIIKIQSNIVETIVSAKSISLNAELSLDNEDQKPIKTQVPNNNSTSTKEFLLHKGTIRAGEHIKSEGDLLVIGDVNPGALVSANGNVMIWGKLLGIAHAGQSGDPKARISALKLKPVQLRIANKVAKGPKENQEPGLAEQAEISSGLIVINPLCP